MNNTSFMTRILWIGAAGITLVAGLFVYVFGSTLVREGGDWQSWAFIGSIVLGVVALNAALWFRLLRRRAALQNFGNSGSNPFTPHSKYAVWGYVPRSIRPRTRKRLRPASTISRDLRMDQAEV